MPASYNLRRVDQNTYLRRTAGQPAFAHNIYQQSGGAFANTRLLSFSSSLTSTMSSPVSDSSTASSTDLFAAFDGTEITHASSSSSASSSPTLSPWPPSPSSSSSSLSIFPTFNNELASNLLSPAVQTSFRPVTWNKPATTLAVEGDDLYSPRTTTFFRPPAELPTQRREAITTLPFEPRLMITGGTAFDSRETLAEDGNGSQGGESKDEVTMEGEPLVQRMEGLPYDLRVPAQQEAEGGRVKGALRKGRSWLRRMCRARDEYRV